MSKENADFDLKKITRSFRSCSTRLLEAVASSHPSGAYDAAKHAVIELATLADDVLLKAPVGLKQRPRTDEDRAILAAYKVRAHIGDQLVAALDPVSRLLVEVDAAQSQAVKANVVAEELLALVKPLLTKLTELETVAAQVKELTERAGFAEERLHETLESTAGIQFQLPRPLVCPYLGSNVTACTDMFIVHHNPESVRSRLKFVVDDSNLTYGIAVLELLTGRNPLMTVFRFEDYNELCATARAALDPVANSADALFVYRAVCAMALGFADAIVDQFGALDTVLCVPLDVDDNGLLGGDHLEDLVDSPIPAASVEPVAGAGADDVTTATEVQAHVSTLELMPDDFVPDAELESQPAFPSDIVVDSAEFEDAERLDARDVVPPDDDLPAVDETGADASGFRPFDAFAEDQENLDEPVRIPGEFGSDESVSEA